LFQQQEYREKQARDLAGPVVEGRRQRRKVDYRVDGNGSSKRVVEDSDSDYSMDVEDVREGADEGMQIGSERVARRSSNAGAAKKEKVCSSHINLDLCAFR
jgi:hypothetical protein